MKPEPCPFCGVTVETNRPGYYIHEENNCFLSGYEFDEEFIEQWNHRSDGWIPVAERLPDDMECRVDILRTCTADMIEILGATNWKPLPKAPEVK